jgi:hypothetical protein
MSGESHIGFQAFIVASLRFLLNLGNKITLCFLIKIHFSIAFIIFPIYQLNIISLQNISSYITLAAASL